MNKRQLINLLKEFYFPILVALAVIIFSPVFLVPKIKQIIKTREAIAAQETQINQLSQKLSDLKSLSEPDLLDSSNLVIEALPSQKDFYKILALSKKIFSDKGAFLNSFDFAPGKVSTDSASKLKADSLDSSQMLLKVNFTASYDNFVSLLEAFSKTLPLMEIDNIKFDSVKATASASFPDLAGILTIKSYYSPLPKFLADLASPLPKISSQGKSLIEELRTFGKFVPEVLIEQPAVVGKDNPFQ